MGCSDDEGISYPTSDAPEIKVLRDELYSNPNRKFVIKADLKDDLGLKSLKIVIPEFYLKKLKNYARNIGRHAAASVSLQSRKCTGCARLSISLHHF